MKTLKYLFAILIFPLAFIGCSDDKDDDTPEPNPIEGLVMIYEFPSSDHIVEVYAEKQKLEVGYNEIAIRVKDLAKDQYISNANMSWMPMMHMETKQHSAPHSMLDNLENGTVYKGHIVFQMAGNETEYWDLSLKYSLNGQPMSEANRIDVVQPANDLKKVQVFMGSDDKRYILAYVSPKNPQVAVNDLRSVLYEMEDMMNFLVVWDYKITIDPRMPGMGNHSSPNNQDMVYNPFIKTYDVKLSLTMTGYWVINLKLINQSGETLKGEDVTEANPKSSLYFEMEF